LQQTFTIHRISMPYPVLPRHIFIATPCFGGTVTQTYLQSIIACMAEAPALNLQLTLSTIGNDALVTRCRNTLLHQFLTMTDASHILFIDADIGFQASDITRLLEARKPVIGALYPLKEHLWNATTTHHQTTGEPPQTASLRYVGDCAAIYTTPPPIPGLVPVAYAGTGFLLIARETLTTLIAAYPETRYRRIDTPNTHTRTDTQADAHALFDCLIDPITGTYLSEDFAFCQRWRNTGGEIWLDRTIRLTHTGPTTFHGNPAARQSHGLPGAAP